MRVYVLTIGDELLYGQQQDTNSVYLAEQLGIIGCEVVGIGSVGDKISQIQEGIRYALTQATCVLLTGGLGPTKDDNTKVALSEVLDKPLLSHPKAKHEIEKFAKKRGRKEPYPESMYCLPESTSPLSNPVGLAVGIWYRSQKIVLAALPGVPEEMRAMYEQSLRPKLSVLVKKKAIRHLYCQTVGITESKLAKRLETFEHSLPRACRLAYLPQPGQVSLRLSTKEQSIYLDAQHKHLQSILTDCLYSTEEKLLEEVLAYQLRAKGLSIAVAESCTVGQIAKRLTLQAGASTYFLGGVIAYQNRLKEKLLGVSPSLLAKKGAVSKEVVEEMAKGVQHYLGADIGLATSGIAGPTGGTAEKPVGTTWIAIYHKSQVFSVCHQFASDRVGNIRYASAYALALLWQHLQQ